MKVWGQEVLKNEEDSLNKTNVRLMVSTVQKAVERHLKSFMFNKAEELHESGVVQKSLDEYLEGLEKRKCIKKGRSYTHVCKKTWEKLYPKFYKRWLARLGVLLTKIFKSHKLTEYKPNLWHFIFPYSINMYVDDHQHDLIIDWYLHRHQHMINSREEVIWEDAESFFSYETMDMEWYAEWLELNPPTACYEATLRVPYNYLDVEIFIQPTRMVEKISLNFSIERN